MSKPLNVSHIGIMDSLGILSCDFTEIAEAMEIIGFQFHISNQVIDDCISWNKEDSIANSVITSTVERLLEIGSEFILGVREHDYPDFKFEITREPRKNRAISKKVMLQSTLVVCRFKIPEIVIHFPNELQS